ncbi:DMT family transporter [Streptomyces gardneri]|uniref:DMT family transporter n=1 Tax=Nocardia sputi TaxID=2943705 RepID=UPI001894FF49|nr:DMT family transporter [Nocardia sputi]MBF6166409.1 DMT family transporter [Streptomyces gardneri]MBF6205189.1 DMT family transporter [Streptomyces gardneri]
MSSSQVAIVFALCAALCIALGAVIRQRAAARTAGAPDSVAAMGDLLRTSEWWLGTLVGAGGFAFQAAALGRGALMLVQPLLVLSLLFALPMGAWLNGRTVSAREWAWALALTAAVAILVVVGDPKPGQSHAEAWHWVLVGLIGVPLFTAALLGARAWPGPRRAVLLGLCSGALFGLAAVLIKGVTATAGRGTNAVLLSAETYALIVVGLTATVMQQYSYRAGSLHASFPAATVVEPIVVGALGFLALGEYLDVNVELVAVLVAAFVTVVVATVALARHKGVDPVPDHHDTAPQWDVPAEFRSDSS